MPTKPKQIHKKKEELLAEAKHLQKIEREKTLVKMMFPHIENQKTIYDAQTVLQALSGFIKLGIEQKTAEIKIKDIKIQTIAIKSNPASNCIERIG